MADGAYDGGRDGRGVASDTDATLRQKRQAFSRTTKADGETVQVRLPAELVRRFDDWFAGQYPGLKQLPKADPYRARVFEHGMAAFETAFPPVESLDERLAALKAS